MWLRQLIIFYCCFISMINAGCVLGPNSLKNSRLNYNRAVQQTTREELLLNLVRMKYHESEEFLRVASITSQFSYDTNIGGSGAWNDTSLLGGGLNLGFGAQSKPTLVFGPEQGKEFNQRKLTPISEETLDLLGSKGWAIDRVLRLTVRNINDIDNATNAGGPTPQIKPDYEEFLYLCQRLRQLQLQDHSLDVTRVDKVSHEPIQVSDLVPLGSVNGEDIINAANDGYRFHIDETSQTATLWKNEVESKVRVLRFAENVKNSEDVAEICRILGLEPGLDYYELKTDIDNGQFSSPSERRTGLPNQRDEILLSTRSIKEMMFYLSHSVIVPERDIEDGIVRLTYDVEGNYFHWPQMTEGLFVVQSSKHKPKDAAIAVKHRGYWFYILDCDLDSKSTFNLLLELINLEIRAGGGQQLPLLTI
jgi:hypothetical protein